MTLHYLDHVSGEGGPLLLADAAAARDWRGSDGDGSDYERACALFAVDDNLPGGSITIGDGKGIVWEMEGAGTADVFLNTAGGLVILRAWLEEGDEMEILSQLAEAPLKVTTAFASIEMTSGVLAILWAPESGECIQTLDGSGVRRPSGSMSTDSSGLLVPLPVGTYSCFHDTVEVEGSEARRCHLVRQ